MLAHIFGLTLHVLSGFIHNGDSLYSLINGMDDISAC